MKQKIYGLICIIVLGSVLVSCTDEKVGSSTVKSTPSVSGSAVEPENPIKQLISDEEVFALSEQILKEMSLDEKIGQMLMVDLRALDNTKKKKKKKITTITKVIKANLKKYPVGGIILFSDNFKSKSQAVKLTDALQKASTYYPLYIAAQEEWGASSLFAKNVKLKGTAYPALGEIKLTTTMEDIYQMGVTTGNELKSLGVNMNLAPIADIADPENNAPHVNDFYSSETDTVSDFVTNAVKGMRDGGVATTAKHFPGIGSVLGDSNETLLKLDDGLTHLRNTNFVPFEAAISAGTDCIMISHIQLYKITQNDTPASMSELIIDGILRNELGFEGVIMTEAMNVPTIKSAYSSEEAVLQAIKAGADIILQPENLPTVFSGVREAVANRSLDEKVLNDSVLRILQNKIKRGMIPLEQSE